MNRSVVAKSVFGLVCICLTVVAPVCLAQAGAIGRERLTPDDLFRLENISDVVVAPDGNSFAFVRRRPLSEAYIYQYRQYNLSGKDRADVWLASLHDHYAVTNITHGQTDGSGFWEPTWSPDSTQLAMLSTRGDGQLRLWIWDTRTQRLRKVSERRMAVKFGPISAFAWIDNRRLAVVLLPEHDTQTQWAFEPHWDYEQRNATLIAREWAKSRAGKEATVSVLDSGVPTEYDKRSREELAILDVDGNLQPIESAPSIPEIRVAPDRHYVAFLREVRREKPESLGLLPHVYGNLVLSELDRYQIQIIDAQGHNVLASAPQAYCVRPNSFRWALDSRAFAFIGEGQNPAESPRVFRGTVGGSTAAASVGEELEPIALLWGSGDRLLVSTRQKPAVDGHSPHRIDWWLLSQSAEPRNVTAALSAVPQDLRRSPDGHVCYGIVAGNLWVLDAESGKWLDLSGDLKSKIDALVWARPNVSAYSPIRSAHNDIIVSVINNSQTELYRINVRSGIAAALKRPSSQAALAAYNPDDGVAIFIADEPTGSYLTVSRGDASRLVAETNQFLRDIEVGETRRIGYRSLDGRELSAWIILPTHYEVEKRYPLIVWVYAGWTAGRTQPSVTQINSFEHPFNLQLLAAHGYAVLLPSMPMTSDGAQTAADPYMELGNGVLPAIDKAIDLGIADPGRLGVMGISFGGFSTYGLVTQTRRFQAAIAIDGLTNLISAYGTFDARARYESFAHELLFAPSAAETGQDAMGNPPWKDLGRYLRNSPIFYVDRVRTPLLIIHGDLDGVPMTQAEEFFTALYRQGKRARFARYWGEGHTETSPANIRDVWKQIYDWLDAFIGSASQARITSQASP